MKPLIMVTNDDSVNAPGLYRLIDVLQEFGNVIAVAPARPQSGMSSAISVNTALRINSLPDYGDTRVFSVNGTPVDCVKLGLAAVMPRKPDFLFSGINHGSNSGTAITYSGTMGAALEGCMAGILSVGFSLLHHSLKADFSFSMPFIREIAAKVIENGLEPGICLNVNIPESRTERRTGVPRRQRTLERGVLTLPRPRRPPLLLAYRTLCKRRTRCRRHRRILARQRIHIGCAGPRRPDRHRSRKTQPTPLR